MSTKTDCELGICKCGGRDSAVPIGWRPWRCYCGWGIGVDADERGEYDQRLLAHRAEHKAEGKRSRATTG